MAIDKHTMFVLDGSSAIFTDRTIVGVLNNVATVVGSGAGQPVTTAITFSEALPASYAVFATSNQPATVNVTSKTSSGFNIVMWPVLAATTLSVGTLDILVIA